MSAKIYPACECIGKIAAQLPSNQALKTKLVADLHSGEIRQTGVLIATESLGGSRKKHREILATYCPFCGMAYTEAPTTPNESEAL